LGERGREILKELSSEAKVSCGKGGKKLTNGLRKSIKRRKHEGQKKTHK